METTDPHHFEQTPTLDARDERPAETYEPPSLTELGSFLELTMGQLGSGTDNDLVSIGT
jgi:hypothetical protein